MPIGVPKVLFSLFEKPEEEEEEEKQEEGEEGESEEQEEEWVDIYDWLYEKRVLFLCETLEDELATQLISVMIYLSRQEPNRDLFLYINSPGGSVTCGIGLYDTMNFITAPVNTICLGTAGSTASFILAGGARGKRSALPYSRIMIHQPEGGNEGQVNEVVSESEEVVRIRRRVGMFYAERTGQSLNKISRDMDRDLFMSAREAKDYGLVDQVVVNHL